MNVTPCHRVEHLASIGDVTLLNTSQFDLASGGIELRLVPLVGRSYSQSYSLRLSLGSKTLLRGTLHARAIWSPPQRIWQGTDAFVNVCIDQGYQLRSSNLQIYCEVPGTESGNVSLSPVR